MHTLPDGKCTRADGRREIIMDYSSVIVAALALVGTLVGSYLSNRKTTALLGYRLEQLEKKQDKHNTLIERTYKLEEEYAIHDEKIRAANRRIDDLEKRAGE